MTLKVKMTSKIKSPKLHMINIIYVALPMGAQTEKTTFSCKDDCTLTKHTWCWTYSANDIQHGHFGQ